MTSRKRRYDRYTQRIPSSGGEPSLAMIFKCFLERTNTCELNKVFDQELGELGDFGHAKNGINEIMDIQLTRGVLLFSKVQSPQEGTCQLCLLPRTLTYKVTGVGDTQVAMCGSVCHRRAQLLKQIKRIHHDAIDLQRDDIPEVQSTSLARDFVDRLVAARAEVAEFLRDHKKPRTGIIFRKRI